MKKLLLLALSFGLLISCKKDDENGIPPVNPDKPQIEKPQDKPATALEVKDLKVADYESYRDKKEKVKLHGEIAEVTNGKSYFKLSDGTLVQIFTHTFKDLKEEVSQKLKTVGQELTVVGTFTDFKAKDGTVVKEIVYESEADLTFGKTPEAKPEQPVVTLEASTATVNDYQAGKTVKLHGNIVIEGNKSYFKFSDNTLIQIFAPKKTFDALTDEAKTKLKTADQELTVVGVFTDYPLKDGTVVKEIVYEKEADLTFGTTTPQAKPEPTPEQPIVTLEASTATVNDYQAGKTVKLHGNIVIEGNKSYFKFSDNTLIQIFAPKKTFDALTDEAKTKLKTADQELTVVGVFTDYPLKDGTVVKEIVYEKEADLTFGTTTPQAKPEPTPEQPIVTLEASTATVNDYKVGEVVKIHGNVTVQVEGKYKRTYFKFSDGTLIQFHVKNYEKTLSPEIRTKLETEGQEVTVKGTFNTYTKTDKKTGTKTDIRQIEYESAADLTF